MCSFSFKKSVRLADQFKQTCCFSIYIFKKNYNIIFNDLFTIPVEQCQKCLFPQNSCKNNFVKILKQAKTNILSILVSCRKVSNPNTEYIGVL